MPAPWRSVATTMSAERATSCSNRSFVSAMGPLLGALLDPPGREPALRVDGGHAAGPGGGHRLPVGGIHGVAAREDAFHGGTGRTRLDLHVAHVVELELTTHEGGGGTGAGG